MIGRVGVVLRIAVAVFCLMTAAYGVLNCSAFAFEMFIRPQLFPWIARFVAWHHLWLAAAYLASLVALMPDLEWRIARRGRRQAAHVLAIAYALCFGIVALWQLVSPHLPTLWNDRRAVPTVIAALLPLVWMAAIDHLAVDGATVAEENAAWQPPGERRLLITSGAVAVYLWIVHAGQTLTRGDLSAGVAVWTLTALWTLVLTLGAFAVVYTIGCAIDALAAGTRVPRTTARGLVLAAWTIGVCEFVRRIVLPTLSVSARDAAIVSVCTGVAVVAWWSGIARRRAPAPAARATTGAMLALLAVPVLALVALRAVERVDWALVGQRAIVAGEWALTFALGLRVTQRLATAGSSAWRVIAPPLVVLIALVGMPRAASRLAEWSGNGRLEPTLAFERYAASDVAFQLASDLFVARKGFDADYYQYLHAHADFSGAATVTVPTVALSSPLTPAPGAKPDIFVFALDSVRRDYLSPYNPAVSFTPGIAALAADGFVFTQAFTRHGGTELAIPSIWAGGMLVRQVRTRGFDRVDAFEKLIAADGYRLLINDFTIVDNLLPTTPVTRLNPGVPSVDTDLCRNLEDLQAHLDAAGSERQPVFAYLSPMNVHIINTQRGGQRSLDGDYPGFYAPYASRLRRLDACFGQFLAYLKAHGRYDESTIVFTTDHGDSLGERGHWGHATWLPPEVVRIPLIVKIPASARASLTTDLARIAFSTDIAPTLYTLLGHPVRDNGPLFGSSLFVPSDATLPDRRRDAFLLTSSYGATYGLLRHNGRTLYVTDLVERRELAYDLSRGAVGVEIGVSHDLREASQQAIKASVAEINQFFHVVR